MQPILQHASAGPSPPPPERDLLEILQLARSPLRVRSSDVIAALFPEAEWLPSPDAALLAAAVRLGEQPLVVLAQEKPRAGSFEEGQRGNFGMMRPEGYARVVSLLGEAEARGWPVLTLIDTPGADPSESSATDLQSWRISDCISRFCTVRTPTLSLILGEGGSGGALALQVTDARLMMENALYSVIAPESCGSIVFRDTSKLRQSLELLQPTARRMLALGLIDEIIAEPAAGARRGDERALAAIGAALQRALGEVLRAPLGSLLRRRRERVLAAGTFPVKEEAPRAARRGALDGDLRQLKVGKLLDLARLAERDHTDGIAYGYLSQQLRQERGTSSQLILCAAARGGCGTYLTVDEYLGSFKACPRCGLGERLSVDEWARCLFDDGAYQELSPELSIADLGSDFQAPPGYREALQRARVASGHCEALVTALATVQGMEVVIALSNFAFMGGSMGAVVGEKLVRAADQARARRAPLISLCASGGARMHEGTLALAQMAKVNMALSRLAEDRVLYLSLITNPTTGGALASYVTRGDVILAEPRALVSFAGPRVAELSGIPLPPRVTTAEFLFQQGGIHELSPRAGLSRALARYVGLYYRLR